MLVLDGRAAALIDGFVKRGAKSVGVRGGNIPARRARPWVGTASWGQVRAAGEHVLAAPKQRLPANRR